MRQIKLTYVGFRAHVKIASRIVSYRSLKMHRFELGAWNRQTDGWTDGSQDMGGCILVCHSSLLLPLTLPSADRLSKFLYCKTRLYIRHSKSSLKISTHHTCSCDTTRLRYMTSSRKWLVVFVTTILLLLRYCSCFVVISDCILDH